MYNTPDNQDLVSLSARVMAACRAIETQRPDGLFNDPLAAILAGDEIIAKVAPQAQQNEAQGKPIVVVRTRFFDDFLISKISQIRQIVILGAGMDTRAFRLPLHPSTHLYELDRLEVLHYKESILGDTASKCHRHSLAIDIKESWSDSLVAKGYKIEIPTVWLAEGFLYYLNETELHELLRIITKLSTSGSWFLADIMNSFLVSQSTENLSAHWKYGCDDPETLLSTYNWKASVVQVGDEGANFGRFTYKLPPRDIPNQPHYFFIKAILNTGSHK